MLKSPFPVSTKYLTISRRPSKHAALNGVDLQKRGKIIKIEVNIRSGTGCFLLVGIIIVEQYVLNKFKIQLCELEQGKICCLVPNST